MILGGRPFVARQQPETLRHHGSVPTDFSEREKCSCYYVSEHTGSEADAYAREHLEEVRVDSGEWLVEYRCPLYGRRWLRDQPWGELHGGGPGRLRTFEKVCRDTQSALGTILALVPGDDDAAAAVSLLRSRLADCSAY